MGRVSALPSANLKPSPLAAPLQELIQQTLFGIALDQARAELGEHAMVKAGVSQFQAEKILHFQAAAYGICGLTISEIVQKLDDGHQCEPPRGFSRLAMRGEQISKLFISVNGAKGVAQLHQDMPMRKCRASDTSRFF